MRIAMLTNNYKPFVGGVPISVERQAEELVKRGHSVTVFAPEYDADKEEKKKGNRIKNRIACPCGAPEKERIEGWIRNYGYDNGIRIIRFGTGKQCMDNGMVYPKLILREITDVFAQETFDLIHTHHPMFVGPTALYLGRKYQIPVVYTYHTRYEDYLHYLDFLRKDRSFPTARRWALEFARETVVPKYMKWFTNQCDLILAPTAGMLKRIRENGTHTQAAVFPTGLKEEFYSGHLEEAMEIHHRYLPQGGVLFAVTGRLEEEKNPGFLLEGVAKLKEKMSVPFQVLFIGSGSMRKALGQKAEELGIADVVHFLGNVVNGQVNRYLQASDLFLFASKSETQGIVLAEAFASGCPVVAVDASGVEDIVENGVNGFRTVEDVDVWSDKVLEALDKREYMGEQAKITAEGYRLARLAAYEELLYGQCIAAKADKQEEMGYEYEEDGAENITRRVFRIFKTS